MEKKHVIFLVILVILVALSICIGTYLNKKVLNTGKVKEFTYSYWNSINEADNSYYLNQLTIDSEGQYHFFYRYGTSDNGEKILSDLEISKFNDIIRTYDIDVWNGYNSQDKENPNNGFIFHIEYVNGDRIEASGSANHFPNNYEALSKALQNLFNDYVNTIKNA